MGILSNTVSICQFQVVGDRPRGDLFEWASDRLSRNSFQPIDNTADEVSSGWVQVDDPGENSFTYPRAFWRDHYLTFTLRRDQRRVPSPLFRARMKNAEAEFLAANPGLRRVPKQKREDLSQAVRGALFAKALPSPSMYDAVWDTRSNRVTFASLSPKVMELFENHFKNTFEGLRLIMLHPFARAEAVLQEDLKTLLLKANKAATGDTLDLIHDNQWLGWDFLLWLTYRTMTQSSDYTVTLPGPCQQGEAFVAYVNDRLVLVGGEEGAAQKISVTGSQDHFSEVRTALHHAKQITEATLYFEKEELEWKMTLKGLFFHFASFKSPSVEIEKDNTTDAANEKEAVFYERMRVLEEGLQLFDSLYASFLETRLRKAWVREQSEIQKWLKSDES
jgi:hypothetical protein